MNLYAGVIIETTDGEVLLQQRETEAGLVNSGKIGIFGGTAEPNETPIECALREIKEELALDLTHTDIQNLGTYITRLNGDTEATESHIFLVNIINPKVSTLKRR